MSYIDDFLQHELELARFATNQVNNVVSPALGRSYEQISAVLGRYDEIKSRSQLNQILAAITLAFEQNSAWPEVTRQLTEFANAEPEIIAGIISDNLNRKMRLPTQQSVLNRLSEAPMTLESGKRVQSALWPDFVKQNIESQSRQISSIVSKGFDRGLTIKEISGEIRQTIDGVILEEAQSLARTGANHFGNIGRQALYSDNSDIIDWIVPVVTFDSRTTFTCRSISDKRWRPDDPSIPWPPLHWNCRTVFVPLLEGEADFTGMRSAVNAGKKPGTRKGGQIPADKKHSAWLREQPEWYVKEALGDTRADLFLKGRLNLDKFTDMAYRPLTLEKLQGKYPAAFRKAGVEL